jgi:phosphoenolpyruvate-protein phosphotransferase
MARIVLEGRPGSPGIGVGAVFRPGNTSPSTSASGSAEASAAVAMAGSDSGATHQRERLLAALEEAAGQLDSLAAETVERAGADIGAIFEAQALFARDPGLVEPALRAIDRDGQSAAHAIELAAAEQADRLAAVDDAYFRERSADLRDVGRRVVSILNGEPPVDLHRADGAPAIIAADDVDASLVATLRVGLVRGIALAGGAETGHAAIVARALGIPMALGIGSSLAATPEGTIIAVDGTAGRVIVEPTETELRELGDLASHQERALIAKQSGAARPAVLDVLRANAGSVREVEQAVAAGAAGIGLFRTELLFLGRSVPPGLEEQRAIYRRVLDAADGRPVVFRTLDIGGDKPAAYQSSEPEANPALGVRGIRLGLRHPELLDTQLRALLEAAPGGELRLMFPMVATLEEVRDARARLDAIVADCHRTGTPLAAAIWVGIMVEVPAAALMADVLAPEVDFLSIGTNDLVQYTLAADRSSPALADLARALQPAVLRLVDRIVTAGHASGRQVSVCGEAAADPLAGPLLVGLGVDQLSVAPAALESVRKRLDGLDPEACRSAAREVLKAGNVSQVRAIAERLIDRDRQQWEFAGEEGSTVAIPNH